MLYQQVADKFLSLLDKIEYGSATVHTPEGKVYYFAGKYPGTDCNATIHDWRFVSAFAAKGDIGLTEAYQAGWWDTSDIADVIMFGIENEPVLEHYIYGSFWANLMSQFLYFFSRNTLKGSKRNIRSHYDLGNQFYSLWLDPSMSYSSAIFKGTSESLEQGQYNKYDRLLERLASKSGQLLEIGCGWGGFAERAISHHDYDVKGITLSEQQQFYANQRLGKQATITLEDYRIQEGKYDHIVSIEMFEAVGEKYWPTYFQKIQSLLSQKGKVLIQTITIDEDYFHRYRKTGDMIRTFIFPGGMLPSLSCFKESAEHAGLKLTDNYAFGQDYAKTLRHWRDEFEAKVPSIKALGFDESFIRVWRFYLSACIAGFSKGRTDVMQLELQHA